MAPALRGVTNLRQVRWSGTRYCGEQQTLER